MENWERSKTVYSAWVFKIKSLNKCHWCLSIFLYFSRSPFLFLNVELLIVQWLVKVSRMSSASLSAFRIFFEHGLRKRGFFYFRLFFTQRATKLVGVPASRKFLVIVLAWNWKTFEQSVNVSWKFSLVKDWLRFKCYLKCTIKWM